MLEPKYEPKYEFKPFARSLKLSESALGVKVFSKKPCYASFIQRSHLT